MKGKYLFALVFSAIFFLGCGDSMFGPGFVSKTIKFEGEEYEFFQPIPTAFNGDTIYPELWFRTLNVDGDNKRILRFVTAGSKAVIPLPNAVNNYTQTTCYSLQIGRHRYLWIEDNFGTTVVDIDLQKKLSVTSQKKELTERAETGAPIGIKTDITVRDIKQRLAVKSKNQIIILDSLTFNM